MLLSFCKPLRLSPPTKELSAIRKLWPRSWQAGFPDKLVVVRHFQFVGSPGTDRIERRLAHKKKGPGSFSLSTGPLGAPLRAQSATQVAVSPFSELRRPKKSK